MDKGKIDKSRIEQNLEDFSFPRLSGTKEETKAFDLLNAKLKREGFTPSIQKFSFSTFYSRVYPKVAFVLIFWLIFVLYIKINELFTLINSFVVAALMIPMIIITRKPENIKFGKVFTSQNQYLCLNNPQNSFNKDKNHIIFIAHVDSKGQRLTVKWRWLANLTWTLSLITMLTVLCLRDIIFQGGLILNIIGIVFLSIHLGATLSILFNTTNNKSRGAIDNASGIATLLELLSYFSLQKDFLEKNNVCFVFTGAEEAGTMGIRNFYKKIKDVNRENTLIFNIESIGETLSLFIAKQIKENLSEYFKIVKEEVTEQEYKYKIISRGLGTHTDGVYLLQKGFHVIELESPDIYKFMHSVEDTPDKVDIGLISALIKMIIKPLTKSKKVNN
ncbi:MAG: M20/M25/M40 family metallo-hydrolase [Promethearchaeia archaeon]